MPAKSAKNNRGGTPAKSTKDKVAVQESVDAAVAEAELQPEHADGKKSEQVPPYKPKTSLFPAYLFAASALFRTVALPLWSTAKTAGLVGRPSFPLAYTAPGLSCSVEALDGPKFCEHEIVFAEQGIALLSCDPGRGEWNTVMGPLQDPDPRGKLFLYDYAHTKTSKELELEGFPSTSDFHPLGINYFSDAMKTSLFVVNHQRTGPSIDIFTINLQQGMNLKPSYQKSIPAQADIKSANGVVALDHDNLYVTNDHAWTRLEQGAIWAQVETYTGSVWGQSWITHIDCSSTEPILTKVAGHIPFANGISRGPSGTIYVASSVLGTVTMLVPFNSSTPLLRRTGQIDFGYSLDNVEVTVHKGEEVVIVGGHGSLTRLIQLSKNPHDQENKRVAPSWISVARKKTELELKAQDARSKVVGRYEPKFDDVWDTRTLYQDDGRQFSASTGAGVDLKGDMLLSTGLYETGVLVCRGVKSSLF